MPEPDPKHALCIARRVLEDANPYAIEIGEWDLRAIIARLEELEALVERSLPSTVVIPLNWSAPAPPGQDGSAYDHCIAGTPFGCYTIEWKSWKDHPGYTVDGPVGFFGSACSLDEAKKLAADHFSLTVRSCLTSAELLK